MDIILTQYSGAILGPIAKLLGWVMNGIYIVLDKIGIQDIGLTDHHFDNDHLPVYASADDQAAEIFKAVTEEQPELQAIQKEV